MIGTTVRRLILNLDEIHYLQIDFFPLYQGYSHLADLTFYTACFELKFRFWNPNADEYYNHWKWVARAYKSNQGDGIPF